MFKVIMEEDVEFKRDEYYIWELIKKRNIDCFQVNKTDFYIINNF